MLTEVWAARAGHRLGVRDRRTLGPRQLGFASAEEDTGVFHLSQPSSRFPGQAVADGASRDLYGDVVSSRTTTGAKGPGYLPRVARVKFRENGWLVSKQENVKTEESVSMRRRKKMYRQYEHAD